ncbi:MAG TPA: polyketide synthase, partial [Polyangiaceae bacterium]|nr:polyketide synthase [Polyangiaceae bacterium]
METRKPSGAEIAVVAAAGRFPGAPDVETFWQNLLDGRESVTFFTDDELRAAGVRDEMLARPDYVKARPTLAGVDLFDADFFRMSPREARFLDPQQRVFLECAWEALERGGYDAARTNLRIGVFAGASVSTYLLQNLAQRLDEDHADRTPIMFGNVGDFLPTRVSYKLGLTGPSVNVQTACSTSL